MASPLRILTGEGDTVGRRCSSTRCWDTGGACSGCSGCCTAGAATGEAPCGTLPPRMAPWPGSCESEDRTVKGDEAVRG